MCVSSCVMLREDFFYPNLQRNAVRIRKPGISGLCSTAAPKKPQVSLVSSPVHGALAELIGEVGRRPGGVFIAAVAAG